MTVKEDVAKVMKDFHSAEKFMGLCCIAPVVAAKVFGKNSGGPGTKLTMGNKGSEEEWPYQGAIDAATSFGNSMELTNLDGVTVDAQNKIVTAPAYMSGKANPGQIYDNVKKMVDTVAQRVRKDPGSALPVSIIVTVEIKPDQMEAFLKAMDFNSQNSRLEEGCYRFDVLQDQENPNKFTFYEVYKDQAAIDFHKTTKHYDAWNQVKLSGAVVSQSVAKTNGVFFGY